jgi:hypothetical protein
MSNIAVIYVGNDNLVEVPALKNELTGADINDATVTVSLADAAGNAVSGETWPKALTYVEGSHGIYRATLPYTLDLVPGGRYFATIVADAGAGLRAEWDIECVARNRN